MASFEKNIPVIFSKSFSKINYELIQYRHREIRKIIPKRLIYSNKNIPLILVKIPSSIFNKFKIKIRPGEEFEVSNNFSRINLMVSDNIWKNILKRLSSNEFQKIINNLQ
jgi:bifunctional pyridoxal-dependent enzyme with beta-cystathionase and maltose regulon repressor activities